MAESTDKKTNIGYIKGLLMGVFAGPLTLPVKLWVDKALENAEKERWADFENAVRRKRGMAQLIKDIEKQPKYELHADGVKEIE